MSSDPPDVTLRPILPDDIPALAAMLARPEVARWWPSYDLDRLAVHLIDEEGHHRLTIDPAAENAVAIRVYEKVGFRPVGRMRQYQRISRDRR